MTHLAKLTEHSLWANELWLGFIESNFPDDEFLLKRMGHILLGEQAWFRRIAGEEPDRNIWRLMTVPELREMHRLHRVVYGGLLAGGNESLERTLDYKRFTGEEYRSPVTDILLHLSTHGMHHRGQMATYVSSKGVPPINTDFIQFCIVNKR